MPEPTLYAWYSAEEAISFFGSPADARRLCDDQWAIFDKTAICLASIGAKWKSSHFDKASSFYWVADKPYRVSDSIGATFVPAEVLPSSGPKRSIRLFVRPPGAERYRYVGELDPPSVLVKSLNAEVGAAYFNVSPTLPSRVLAELGIKLGELDFAAVDAALDRLRQPTTVQDRVSVLQKLVHYWHGPIGLEDGISEAEMKIFTLPSVLRWWYQWAGRRSEIMTAENFLFVPNNKENPRYQPTIVDGHLLFYVENRYAYAERESAYQWSTLPDGDDPPVFGRTNDDQPWQAEGIRLSEHLILACLFEAIMCHAKYGVWCKRLEEDRFVAIAQNIAPIAIPPWRWRRLQFYAGRGAFMCAAIDDENSKIWHEVSIAAKTEHPLQFLKPLLGQSRYYGAI